jgi:predicted O-methyltransferase YrrM
MRKEIEQVRSLVSNIEGWLTDKEGELLYDLAKARTNGGCIVEIGSWKGRSTIWLATGSKDGRKFKIYSIDPHTGSSEHKAGGNEVSTFDEFMNNIKRAGCEDIIIPLVMTSEDAASQFNNSVELLFIDGSHEYDNVKADIELWVPKLMNGGTVALHDTIIREGVNRAVKELILKSKHFNKIGFIDSITFAQKTACNTWIDRVRNSYIILIKDIYAVARRLRLLKPFKSIGKKMVRKLQ